MGGQQRLAGLLQRRIVVAVEVVEPDDAIAALAEGEGNVRPDEACGASDEHGDGAGAARGGGGPDLFLQAHPTPRRTEVAGGDASEALEAEVTGNERDQEQCPKEHVAGRAKHLWNWRLIVCERSIFPFPGVDGSNSSSINPIFFSSSSSAFLRSINGDGEDRCGRAERRELHGCLRKC
ncbi:unnamed protein product, partial [Musa acuminata subsp. burmannicoides]